MKPVRAIPRRWLWASVAVVLAITGTATGLVLSLGGVAPDPGSWPQTAAFSADSKYLVTAGLSEAQVIDPTTGRVLARWRPEPHGAPRLDAIGISRDDKTIVTAALGHVRRWSVGDVLAAGVGGRPRPLSAFDAAYPEPAASHVHETLSADGALLLVGTRSGGVVVWSTATGRVRDRIRRLDVVGASLPYVSPDDRVVAGLGMSGPGGIELWDISAASPRLVRVDPNAGFLPVFTPDDGVVTTTRPASQGSTRLLDDATGKQLVVLPPDDDPDIDPVAYSPAAGLVARLSFSLGSVTVWSVASGRIIAHLTPAAGAVDANSFLAGLSLAFSPNGKTLAVLSGSGPAWLWQVPRAVLRSANASGTPVQGGTTAERP